MGTVVTSPAMFVRDGGFAGDRARGGAAAIAPEG